MSAIAPPVNGLKPGGPGTPTGPTDRKPAQSPGEFVADFRSDGFEFGLGSAPAHSEDRADPLKDSWQRFAGEGRVACFKNRTNPEQRLNFWSNPAEELDLAAATGARVFRLGLDWARLVPDDPRTHRQKKAEGFRVIQDAKALEHYRGILQMVRDRGMNPLVSLFHHSLPSWAVDDGGWTNPAIRELFTQFSKDLIDNTGDLVDRWIPFNEPAVFAAFSYIKGMWPTDRKGLGIWDQRHFDSAIRNMSRAHKQIYDYAHSRNPGCQVGLANFTAKMGGAGGVLSKVVAGALEKKLNFCFPDKVAGHLDFLGVNYYGEERIRNMRLIIDPDYEYSENGKAVNPTGLYESLHTLHERYNIRQTGRGKRDKLREPIPLIVTENGIADAHDYLRPAYLVEHLAALDQARQEGVPVKGYYHWTTSDNLEWADGYGPEFGLVEVDREHDLARKLRPSYYLFQEIARTGVLTAGQRQQAWEHKEANLDKEHPMYRGKDGESALDEPWLRPVHPSDWRFSRRV